MNVAHHRQYLIEFDVWDPMTKEVNEEIQASIDFIKKKLDHAANVKISFKSEEKL